MGEGDRNIFQDFAKQNEHISRSYLFEWIKFLNTGFTIKGSVVNFICEAKSVSKQDVLIMVTLCNEQKPCFPSWLLFPVFIRVFRI